MKIKYYYSQLIIFLLALCVYSPIISAQDFICYAVADEGNPDVLFIYDSASDNWSLVGSTGVSDIEAITYDVTSSTIYAVNSTSFGSIDAASGAFTLISNLGSINGSQYGSILVDDVDGLSYDLINNVIWASQRIAGLNNNDVVFQIDPATGLVIPNAFGAGLDYISIEEVFDGTVGIDVFDVDDLAVNPTTGELFVISNMGGVGGVLSLINTADGSIEEVVGDFSVDDLEGLSFNVSGNFFGTTGGNGPVAADNNLFYSIDVATATTSVLSTIDPSGANTDFEALECLASASNTPPCDVTPPVISANTNSVCVGVDEDVIVGVTDAGSGTTLQYIITDATATNILDGPTTNNVFNLAGAPTGTCLIWGINSDGTFNAPTSLVADLEGCFALSVEPWEIVREDCTEPCLAASATIIADSDAICIGEGDVVNVTVTNSGVGPNLVFVVTDGAGATILAGPTTDTQFSFDTAPPGTCLIWAVTHDGTINIPTNQVADITGCFALSNSLPVTREDCEDPCLASSATISADANSICIGQGDVVNVTVNNAGVGPNLVFVVTDNAGATILAGPTTDTQFSFDTAPPGTCLIWAVTHDGTIAIPSNQVADITGCFALSNSLPVSRMDCNQNNPPIAVDDNATTCFANPVLIDVFANDYDMEGDPFDLVDLNVLPANGTIVINAGGTFTYTPNPGFTGSDSFQYTIGDGMGGFSTATVSVNVLGAADCTNNPPIAGEDHQPVPFNTPFAIDILANDYDFEDDDLSVTLLSSPNNGTIVLNADGTVTYTPDNGFVGTDFFSYLVMDDSGLTDTANVIVKVLGPGCDISIAPTAISNVTNICLGQGENVVVQVTNPGNGPLLSFLVTDITGTTILAGPQTSNVFNFDGAPVGTCLIWAVTHDATLAAPTNLVADVEGCFVLTTSPIAVIREDCGNMMNDAPIIGEDENELCTLPITPITICVDGFDPNGDNVVITEVETLFNCSIDMFNDTCFVYTPLPGLTGTDTVTVIACDDGIPVLCDTVQYFIFIGCATPDAVNDVVNYCPGASTVNGEPTAINNGAISVNVLGNDSDPCNGSLNVSSITSEPENGSVQLVMGVPMYEPDEDFVGDDSFSYEVCNDCGSCETASVSVNVCGDPAACNNDTLVVCVEPVVPVTICVTDFCALEDGTQSIIGATTTFNCSIEILTNLCIEYTQLPGFVGTDTIVIVGMDGTGAMDTVIVLAVQCDEPPICELESDMETTDQDTPIIIDVLGNDILECGNCIDPADITNITAGPDNGTAVINLDGTVTYTPDAGFSGMDFFTYEVCDCEDNCYEANAVITVNPIVLPTIEAVLDQDTTASNTPVSVSVLDNDLGDNIIISEVCDPSNGTAVIFGMNVVYVPDPEFAGLDTFCYVICTDVAPIVCDTADIIIFVEDMTDDYPVIVDENEVPVNDTIYNVTFVDSTETIICLDAIDPNDEEVEITILENGELGIGVLDEDGCLVYEAGPNTGMDTIIIIACDEPDPDVLCDTLVVIIDIMEPGPNNPPMIFPNDTLCYETPEDTPYADCLDIIDPEDDDFGITITQNGSNGTLTLDSLTCWTYIPNENYNGMDTIYIDVCDEFGNCTQGVIKIDVLPVNDAPVAVNDGDMTDPSTPVVIDVLGNDFDVDGDMLTVKTIVEDPANGEAFIDTLNGTITYVPFDGFSGLDSFMYAIQDEEGLCDTATVFVIVGESMIPIAANDDEEDTPCGEPVTIDVLANDVFTNADITFFTNPANGTIELDNTTGIFTYTPNEGFCDDTDCFTYTLTDMFGQSDIAEVCINIGPGTVELTCDGGLNDISQVLTPNNDGFNDLWSIQNIESCCENPEVLIFNRWGNIVFNDSNFTNTSFWDGSWSTEDGGNGQYVPDGTYFYCILCPDAIEGEVKYDGFIEVINP